jgi:hypothetical protein
MYAILIFPNGKRVDAVLLSATEDRLRLAIAGRSDVTELQRIGGRWATETGTPVEFGAMVACGGAAEKRPRALAAGQPS